jgi:hypothetical protein
MTTTTATATATATERIPTPAARPPKTEIRPPKALPAPNSDFYQLADVLTPEEMAVVKKVRAYMESSPADHQQVLVRRCVSVRAAAVIQGAGPRRPRIRGLRLRRRKSEAVRLRRAGAGARRRFYLHLLRRSQRSRHGLDLSRRIGGAEAEVAAADGALGKDRLLRAHRAPGGFGNKRRDDHDRQTRRGHLDSQRPETMDRQRAMVRCFDHLGARSPTTRSRVSSSRTRPRPASASRKSSTRSRSR